MAMARGRMGYNIRSAQPTGTRSLNSLPGRDKDGFQRWLTEVFCMYRPITYHRKRGGKAGCILTSYLEMRRRRGRRQIPVKELSEGGFEGISDSGAGQRTSCAKWVLANSAVGQTEAELWMLLMSGVRWLY